MAKPNPTLPPLSEQDIQRFHSKIKKGTPDDCWPWLGVQDRDGYGLFKVTNARLGVRKMLKAHRVSYYLHRKQDPSGFLVLHSCDNPPCNNPAHLRTGTTLDNSRDQVSKGRHMYGAKQKNAVFTDALVRKIREMHEKVAKTMKPGNRGKFRRRVARLFNVSEVTIQKIVHKKQWRHTL